MLPFAIIGIKFVTISGGNTEVFRYLVQNLNLTVLLMSTIVPLIPTAVFWFYVIGAEWFFSVPRDQRTFGVADWIAIPIIGFSLWLPLLMPAAQFVANVGLVVLMLILRGAFRRLSRWLIKRGHDVNPDNADPIRTEFLQTFMMGVVAAVVTVPAIWLPTEIINVRGSEPKVGYVLSMQDQWTTFLDRDKKIHTVKSSQVESRSACASASWAVRPIIEVFSTKMPNPACPPE